MVSGDRVKKIIQFKDTAIFIDKIVEIKKEKNNEITIHLINNKVIGFEFKDEEERNEKYNEIIKRLVEE